MSIEEPVSAAATTTNPNERENTLKEMALRIEYCAAVYIISTPVADCTIKIGWARHNYRKRRLVKITLRYGICHRCGREEA